MNNVIEYERPDQQAMLRESAQDFEIAQTFQVTSIDTYTLAAEEAGNLKQRVKRRIEARKSLTSKLDVLKAEIMGLFAPGIEQDEATIKYYECGMITYSQEQLRKQQQEQERLDAIAREERARLARIEAEANAEAERIKYEAEKKATKAKTPGEANRILDNADIHASEKHDIASSARNESAAVFAAPSAVVVPMAAGTSIRKAWKGRCTNLHDAIQFVSHHPEYERLLMVDESALNDVAKALKQNMRVDGCEAYEVQSVISRQLKGVLRRECK